MAFVKKRKAGYYAVAEYRDNMNQRHQKGAGTFKLKREALEAAQKLEKKLNGVDVDLTKLSLAQYFQRWYELFKKPGITKATQNRYNIIGRVIADYFGVKKIAEIRRSDYQAFINWYGANHARDSVVKLNGAMRACVGAAIDDDLITKDFTHNVQLVHDKSRQLRVEYLNTDELLKLKQATAKGLNPRYSARYMILTAILTGMRKRAKYQKLRAKLQAKGTKSAKRRLKKLSGRENRWMTDVNHQLSKTLVQEFGSNTLFVLEDLTGVSFERTDLPKVLRNQNKSWAFYQLAQFLTYKAHLNNSEVIEVSAQYTSQRCPKCGTIKKSHRNHDLHEYHCSNCGYRSNDDRLGAMNIQLLGTQYISGQEQPEFELTTNA